MGLALFGLARLGVSELPGTFEWRSKAGNATIYAPVGLMILVSVVATILLSVIRRR